MSSIVSHKYLGVCVQCECIKSGYTPRSTDPAVDKGQLLGAYRPSQFQGRYSAFYQWNKFI